ncbi:nuclear transport factor 2 family protein [Natronomonas sp.]|uniref:nuclear transport factor 2 family protein n=1 Tax=Natronomonas sp. TaxID=2184060 RepID=UPI002611D18D|nr:nuclear transport factor 2 family protein [Natronomonas sp.]
MDPRTTVRAYYDALRAGDPLGPYFASEDETAPGPASRTGPTSEHESDDNGDDPFVKFGISERLVGSEEIRSGLRAQTETTTDWDVESHALRVCERDRCAWFSDEVTMAWTTRGSGRRREFETRWSGTLARSADRWRFVGMHVSTADDL